MSRPSSRDVAARERTDRDALIRIVEVWRPHAARLTMGLVLSLLAVLAGLALMSSAGLRFAGAALGMVLVTTTSLRVLGLGRIILRYSERLYAHDAMFRALATLRVWFFRSLAQEPPLVWASDARAICCPGLCRISRRWTVFISAFCCRWPEPA